jgi:hypothetical protein
LSAFLGGADILVEFITAPTDNPIGIILLLIGFVLMVGTIFNLIFGGPDIPADHPVAWRHRWHESGGYGVSTTIALDLPTLTFPNLFSGQGVGANGTCET